MTVKSRIYNSTLYVVLCGELDEYVATEARTKMDQLFDGVGFNQIIIDMSELNFMDSTGIGVLLGRYNKLKSKNIPIYICNPSVQAERILQLTGLYKLMPKVM